LRGESWDEQASFTSQKVIEWIEAHPAEKNVDWNWVQKQVVASEPPKILDVPAHIKFCQVWGGGTRQKMMTETMDYIQTAMVSERVVSGSFFEKLAQLKFPPHELIPRTVHACLITQAVGPRERDHVGTTLTEPQIKSLMTTNKAKGMQVNTMLLKANELIRSQEVTTGVHSPKNWVLLGDMACELVKFIFDVDSKFKSLAEISKDFSEKFIDIKKIEPVSKPKSSKTNDKSMIDVFQHEQEGSNAGRITVESSGYFVGNVLESKGKVDCSSYEQHEIAYINDDGSVGIVKVLTDGSADTSVQVFKLNDLVKKFRVVRYRIELFENYPKNSAKNGDEMKDMINRSAVVFALNHLENSKAVDIKFRCQKKPIWKLFALDSVITAGALRIVPHTVRIATRVAGVSTDSSTVVECKVDGKALHLNKYIDERVFIAEFWVLRVVHDQKEANMKMKSIDVKLYPDGMGYKGITVSIPCAENTKKVTTGDELVLFRPEGIKQSRPAASVPAMLPRDSGLEKKPRLS
jgi:hypothetical protein